MGFKPTTLAWRVISLLSVPSLLAADADLRLAEAAKNQDKVAVQSLLKQRANVNAAWGDGTTALLWAAHWGDSETAALLIRAGANVNAATDNGVTPLWEACSVGNAAIVEELLKGGAKPDLAQEAGVTPLMMCAKAGNSKGAELLLAKGANANAKESVRNQTALMWAVANHHADIARMLIEHRADVHARSRYLVLPAAKSDEYDSGAGNYEGDFQEVPKGGFTALMFAAQQGDLDSVEALLAAGANPSDSSPGGGSALVRASANAHEDVAKFLLEHGADPNRPDENGMTALHYTVFKGYMILRGHHRKYYNEYLYRPDMPGLVKVLLAHGANPNARITKGTELSDYVQGHSPIGATALLLAAVVNDAEIMHLLTAAGADPNLSQENGLTPLLMAGGLAVGGYGAEIPLNRLETVKVAVEAGGNVNAADDFGRTALHAAAALGMNDVIKYLADKGATLDVKDRYGQTPWSLAADVIPPGRKIRGGDLRVRPNKSTADLLIKLGATPVSFPGGKRPNTVAASPAQ